MEVGVALAAHSANLESLLIGNTAGTANFGKLKDNNDAMEVVLKSCKRLEYIDLPMWGAADDTTMKVIADHCPQLKRLGIGMAKKITNAGN